MSFSYVKVLTVISLAYSKYPSLPSPNKSFKSVKIWTVNSESGQTNSYKIIALKKVK